MTRSRGIRARRRPPVDVTCDTCGTKFKRWVSLAILAKRHFCSRACQARSYAGVVRRSSGYVIQRAASHPRAMSNGYVRQHRLVAERKIGRALQASEVVHHLNHDRADNRPENLVVMTRSEHQRHHQRERGRTK